jgi:hypothetical protein
MAIMATRTGNAFDVFHYPARWKNHLFGGVIFGLGCL